MLARLRRPGAVRRLAALLGVLALWLQLGTAFAAAPDAMPVSAPLCHAGAAPHHVPQTPSDPCAVCPLCTLLTPSAALLTPLSGAVTLANPPMPVALDMAPVTDRPTALLTRAQPRGPPVFA